MTKATLSDIERDQHGSRSCFSFSGYGKLNVFDGFVLSIVHIVNNILFKRVRQSLHSFWESLMFYHNSRRESEFVYHKATNS